MDGRPQPAHPAADLGMRVRELTLRSTAPALTYEEGSLVKRSIRDLYSKDIDEVIVEGAEGYREARDFMRMIMPSHAKPAANVTACCSAIATSK